MARPMRVALVLAIACAALAEVDVDVAVGDAFAEERPEGWIETELEEADSGEIGDAFEDEAPEEAGDSDLVAELGESATRTEEQGKSEEADSGEIGEAFEESDDAAELEDEATSEEMSAESSAFLSLVNKARQRAGVGNLTYNNRLNQAAKRHAKDYYHYSLNHTGSDGSTIQDRIRATGYRPMRRSGENVYWENPRFQLVDPGKIENAFNWWMQSPPHRANMLRSGFKEMGFARHDFGSKQWRWSFVQVFGARS